VITALAVENYRSLRRMVLATGRLNVVTGPNGSGKSSLYRALRLLGDSARNGAVAALAREGGLESVMWAGSPDEGRSMRRGRGRPLVQGGDARRLLLGFAGEEFGYAVDLGVPARAMSMFGSDPEIKAESVWAGAVLRPAAVLADRGASGAVRLRAAAGVAVRETVTLAGRAGGRSGRGRPCVRRRVLGPRHPCGETSCCWSASCSGAASGAAGQAVPGTWWKAVAGFSLLRACALTQPVSACTY
jgi:AAA domain, putative AbiEii toxin, Type IV TA system